MVKIIMNGNEKELALCIYDYVFIAGVFFLFGFFALIAFLRNKIKP